MKKDILKGLMKIPSYPTKRKKMSVSHDPTPEQENVINEIKDFFEDDNLKGYLLAGYAGTGKSFITTKVIQHYLDNYEGKILICAPTNSAVSVTSGLFDSERIDYRTIHSALALKMMPSGDGNRGQIYTKNMSAKEIPIESADVVIIDEASMIPEPIVNGISDSKRMQFVDGIVSYMNNPFFKTKYIFVGDDFQLPPVNEAKPILFTSDFIDNNAVQKQMLTKVVRQAKGNPIIRITTSIREKPFSFFPLRKLEKSSYGEYYRGVFYFNDVRYKPYLIKLINKVFNSENFKSNPYFAKILSYTNAKADKYNTIVRELIYGEGAPRIVKGEYIITTNTISHFYGDTQDLIYKNNEQLQVIDYTVQEVYHSGHTIKVYSVETKSVDEIQKHGDCETKRFIIVHENGMEAYNEMLNDYIKEAEAEYNSAFERREWWAKYYDIITRFGQFTYSYSLTTHKAQGMTYQNCFVVADDILSNGNIVERNKMLYTAFTRPSERLFVFLDNK